MAVIWGKRNPKMEKDKIKEVGIRGGGTQRRRKRGKAKHKEKMEEQKVIYFIYIFFVDVLMYTCVIMRNDFWYLLVNQLMTTVS